MSEGEEGKKGRKGRRNEMGMATFFFGATTIFLIFQARKEKNGAGQQLLLLPAAK